MPGVIMLAAVFALFLVEMWLKSKTGGHSHGGAKGEELTGQAITQGHHPRGHGMPEIISNPISQQRRHSYDSQETMAFRDEKRNWVSET